VLYDITKIIMIFFMLTAQIGESFALSSIPCADDGMMVMNGNKMDHSKHAMTIDKSSVVTEEDCCQKDCCCPMGLMTVAVSGESNIDTPIDHKTLQSLASHSNTHEIFIALPQRPPKITLS
jgi:hypothetical protein